MAAEPGHHDDLVSACAAAVTGWFDLHRFEKPEPPAYPQGTMGQIMEHDAILRPQPQRRPAFQFAKRR